MLYKEKFCTIFCASQNDVCCMYGTWYEHAPNFFSPVILFAIHLYAYIISFKINHRITYARHKIILWHKIFQYNPTVCNNLQCCNITERYSEGSSWRRSYRIAYCKTTLNKITKLTFNWWHICLEYQESFD